MVSPAAEKAIEDAYKHGRAVLKFLSRNDVGLTKSHQSGFLLPTPAWKFFTVHPPDKGKNQKHPVAVTWPDGRITKSVVTWYGAAKHEYRLTCFGKNFPYKTHEDLGNLFVLIPKSIKEFFAYSFDTDDDIDAVQDALDVQVTPGLGSAMYEKGKDHTESVSDCISRNFRTLAGALTALPKGKVLTKETIRVLEECVKNYNSMTADERLMLGMDNEYALYKMMERQVYGSRTMSPFADLDEVLKYAKSISQGRVSRAGQSLENHVEKILRDTAIPLDMRVKKIKGVPDLLIPGKKEYEDKSYPKGKMFAVGIKRTCKDRWRQVALEAPEIPNKYILTLQEGISPSQLKEMKEADISLIVPAALHKHYKSKSGITILTVEEFISKVKALYP